MVGLGKDSLELVDKIKALVGSQKSGLIVQLSEDLDNRHRKRLQAVYGEMEQARPVAERLLQRLRNHYLAFVVSSFASWLALAAIAWIMRASLLILERNLLLVILLLIVLLAAGYSLKYVWREPLANLPRYKDFQLLQEASLSSVMFARNRLFSETENEAPTESWGLTKRSLSRLAASERAFLENYLRLDAMLNCLESYLLTKALVRSQETVWESFSRGMLRFIGGTINALVQEGRLTTADPLGNTNWSVQQRLTLQEEFKKAGIDDILNPALMAKSVDDFYATDFARLASAGPEAIEAKVSQFLPLQSR